MTVHYANGRNMRKRTFWHVRPTKTQISLRIRAVWSVFIVSGQSDQCLLCPDEETLHHWLSKMWQVKIQIRLREYAEGTFSDVAAEMYIKWSHQMGLGYYKWTKRFSYFSVFMQICFEGERNLKKYSALKIKIFLTQIWS